MNTVPLRMQYDPDATFKEMVQHVKDVLLAGLAHEDIPFHRVMARLKEDYGPSAAAIGEVAFVMDDPEPRELVVGDIALARVESPDPVSRREITLQVVADGVDLRGTMTYDRDLFAEETIEGIVAKFQAALASVQEDLVMGGR
jgi:non-ribosomal peptide synthetase component F